MARKHGLAPRNAPKHPLFKTWCEMRYRCENPAKHNYRYYGGRGIKVCPRWQAFEAFVTDMGGRPVGATLDRINPNGDYEPSNCRWAQKKEQANNTRANRLLVYGGEEKTLSEWASLYGIRASTLWRRLEIMGWGLHDALTTPKYGRRTQQSSMRAEGRIG